MRLGVRLDTSRNECEIFNAETGEPVEGILDFSIRPLPAKGKLRSCQDFDVLSLKVLIRKIRRPGPEPAVTAASHSASSPQGSRQEPWPRPCP